MTRRVIIAGLLLLLGISALSAQLSMMGIGPSGSGVAAPCVPGAPTGQMDFSVCSNIAITAAVF
jgi:hypothetical protein